MRATRLNARSGATSPSMLKNSVAGQHRRTLGRAFELTHRAFHIQMWIASQPAASQPCGVEQGWRD